MITHLGGCERRLQLLRVHIHLCAPNPLGLYRFKMTREWPISSHLLGHLYLSFFCKGRQIGMSLRNNTPLCLGHNSGTGLGQRGAQSLALQEESGPELFPGGLDADSDVVPTVRCQQERGVRLSAWVWDVMCVKGGEKTQSGCMCVNVCAYLAFVVRARSFSHKTNGQCWSHQVYAATYTNRRHTSFSDLVLSPLYCIPWCLGKTYKAYSTVGTVHFLIFIYFRVFCFLFSLYMLGQ